MVSIIRHYQRGKNGVHAVQALLIFIAAAMTIAVFTKGGQSDGRVTYHFALCWLCIPALIYQTAFPVFERTKRFANPYVHAVIDILYTILWFSAFIALLVWAKQGSEAAKDWDDKKDKVCDKFAWGPPSKCKVGRATGYVAIIIWLLFAITAAISIYGVTYHRTHGTLPLSTSKPPEAIPTSDQEEDYIFSSNPHDKLDQQQELPLTHHDDDDNDISYHRPHDEDRAHQNRPSTPDPPLLWTSHSPPNVAMGEGWNDRRRTPELPVGENYYPVDTSYHGGRQSPYDPPPLPQHLSSGRASSPHYDTYMHSNESGFVGGMSTTPRPLRPSAGDPFADEVRMGDGDGRIEFPEGEYARLGR